MHRQDVGGERGRERKFQKENVISS
jgi:hypothetical protein